MFKKNYFALLFTLISILTSNGAFASSLAGDSLSLWWGLPFVCILLSIALGPIVLRHIWHAHFGKITLFWTLTLLVPMLYIFGWHVSLDTVSHALITEYIPFILLLLTLYTISGGILIHCNWQATPLSNTGILAIGTVLASIMGTTGAAMLLIRPLLKTNEHRVYRVHVVVFFIFLVANIGGGLTPLGDPPLFLGFLKGVSFVWTLEHMLLPVAFSSVLLLFTFYMLDKLFIKREKKFVLLKEQIQPISTTMTDKNAFAISGKGNFLLLIAVVLAILMSGIWHTDNHIIVLGNEITLPSLTRDILMILFAILSLWLTPKTIREKNQFNWNPMKEVGKLFLGIFITISPVIAILQAGINGHFSSIIQLVHDPLGNPINAMYFWMSGLLSAFLDNAPTYLIFFNMAGGDALILMEHLTATLLAVSMGSVFMGALSYIGNAPNFMVKAIAEERGVAMPSFFGYMAWSCCFLLPLFVIQTLVFFIF